MKFKIKLEKKDHGGYQVTVPSLPGCISSGFNEAEALERVQSEIFIHLGVEVVPQAKAWRGLGYYKNRLVQFMVADMSQEKKVATLTTMAGLFLMMATILGAGILFP